MPEVPNPNPRDEQIGAFFNVIGHVARDPDPSGFGYTYESGASIALPVGHVSEQLQIRHGLDAKAVLERFLAASELAVVVRQHIEPQLPEGKARRLN